MEEKYTKEICIELLKNMQQKLQLAEQARFPKRSDFSEEEVCAIKAFLGPWPRALEKAGLKDVRDDGRAERTLQKRIASKRRRTEAKINRRENA